MSWSFSIQKGSSILASRCCHRMLVFDDSRQVFNGVRVTEGGGYSHRYTVLAHSLLSEARFIKQVVYCICKTISRECEGTSYQHELSSNCFPLSFWSWGAIIVVQDLLSPPVVRWGTIIVELGKRNIGLYIKLFVGFPGVGPPFLKEGRVWGAGSINEPTQETEFKLSLIIMSIYVIIILYTLFLS